MSETLIWIKHGDDYRATGDGDREYFVHPLPGSAEFPWEAGTTAPREPRKERSRVAAQRLCQAWEDGVGADG
jgi:hypothetical protein